MKKILISIVALMAALCAIFAFGCGKSDAPVVGTYYLVEVKADNGTVNRTYTAEENGKTAFVLNIRDNYKWDMVIQLPGITDEEDGKWEDNNGAYTLREDRDDPKIPIVYNNGTVEFTMTENNYVLKVTLSKN